jgi:hypothetical protein
MSFTQVDMTEHYYTSQEFEEKLRAHGCVKTEERVATAIAWQSSDGKYFLVPDLPEEHYPDWMFDAIVLENALKA